MSTINLNLGQLPFSSNLRYSQYLDCLKFAIEVIVTFLNTDPPSTEVAFRGPDGTVERDCLFYFRGNLYNLPEGESQTYTPQPGGTDTPDAPLAAAMATSFTFAQRNDEGELVEIFTVKGLDPVSPSELISILTDTLTGYERFVALLDDDTTVTGSEFKDEIEVGAGDDTVIAGAGNDLILKWRPGDLDASGGAGIDEIGFSGSFTVFDPPPLVEQLVIDLAASTGRNPFGGALTLKSIELVHTLENVADVVFGSRRAETVSGGFSDGDEIAMRGGNDLVQGYLVAGGAGLIVDGGAGTDTVDLSEIYTPSVLDLDNAATNAGVFAGCEFQDVEVLSLTARSGTGGTLLDLNGTAGDDIVRFFATFLFAGNPIGAAVMRLGQGNDSAHGGGGADTSYGGAGNDSLDGDNATHIPRGNDQLFGGAGDDVLDGWAGEDRLYGGADRDRIEGDLGDDVLTGGTERDWFIFADGFGDDRVTDFRAGTDRLDFRGHAGIDNLNDLKFVDRANGLLVKDGLSNTVFLVGLAAADLQDGDILV